MLGLESGPLNESAGGFSARLGDISLYVFKTDGSAAHGRDAGMERNSPGIDHLAFEVEDFDAAQAELESRDVSFVQDVVGEPGGFRYREFQDPEGNMVYVIHKGG